jgi:hypothetical protein
MLNFIHMWDHPCVIVALSGKHVGGIVLVDNPSIDNYTIESHARSKWSKYI